MSRADNPSKKKGIGRAVVLVGFFLFGILYGYFARQNDLFPSRLISFAYESIFGAGAPGAAPGREHLTKTQRLEIERLESLGYSSGASPAPEASGVTIYEPRRAFDGLSCYCAGHRPEAWLIDMKGNVVHTWSYDIRSIEPDLPPQADQTWIHVHLFENGDLCAIYEKGYGLIKLDKDSRLLWRYPGKAHHDLEVAGDGRIYVLTHEAGIIPRINARRPVMDDFITVLSPEGRFLRRVSILEAFEKSDYAPELDRMPRTRELLHTNSIRVLDGSQVGRSPLFAKGNVLISARQIDTIAIVDMEAERVVWAVTGMWRQQHQPSLLADGNMLIFDNNTGHDASRVIEFEPLSKRIVWQYGGDSGSHFYSELSGAVQRLPNGDTLIVESCRGRAFEVTPDKAIVWEFFNPAREGDHNELIPDIWKMVRVGPASALPWLAAQDRAEGTKPR